MAALCKFAGNVGKILAKTECRRNLTFSAVMRLKQIIETKEGNTLTIRAEPLPDDTKKPILKNAGEQAPCILCEHNLEVKHTDVLILNQYLDSNHEVLPLGVTQLCLTQYKRIKKLIKMSKAAGLLEKSEEDKEKLELGKKWFYYNTYYDEKTIPFKYF